MRYNTTALIGARGNTDVLCRVLVGDGFPEYVYVGMTELVFDDRDPWVMAYCIDNSMIIERRTNVMPTSIKTSLSPANCFYHIETEHNVCQMLHKSSKLRIRDRVVTLGDFMHGKVVATVPALHIFGQDTLSNKQIRISRFEPPIGKVEMEINEHNGTDKNSWVALRGGLLVRLL